MTDQAPAKHREPGPVWTGLDPDERSYVWFVGDLSIRVTVTPPCWRGRHSARVA